ncbi:type I addiction module toxin, SymE family (plasmid) [Enterobacteriaceae bacterium Kacie_13]|nr:type I addiction module toxin, SymE family [Enterobacteriaceae bacterium Kacie_13]
MVVLRIRFQDLQNAEALYRRLCAEPSDTTTPNIYLKGNWLCEAGFETGAHLTVKISDGCIVIIKDSEEVDELKREKDILHQQQRDIKLANQNIKNAAKAALREIRV